MSTATQLGRMSYAEYLAFERSAEGKHEWVNGEVYAMAGGTPEHARLAMAVGIQLAAQFGPRGYRVYSSDLRVRIRATGRATYPDVTVVCGPSERDPEDGDAITNPTLIVEVLSPTTEGDDRGNKWQHYRRLTSLRAYVLVDASEERVEVFTRSGEGWLLREAGPGEKVELGLFDAQLEADALYAGRER